MKTEIQQTINSICNLRNNLHKQLKRNVVGLEEEFDLLLVALLAGGHVLLEGVPGVAKTLFAKSLSTLLGADFQRIQFTPDLLPSDITGGSIFDRKTSEFVLRKGPVFTHILLSDEINRSPAKTQSALLEAMQERQVTIEGKPLPLPDPFLVLATQNPIEEEGVYRLPEAQLDRFFLRVRFPYPNLEEEIHILETHSREIPRLESMTSMDVIRAFQKTLQEMPLSKGIYQTIGKLAQKSRVHPAILLGMSPRASLCLLQAARAKAVLEGRNYVIHEDVKGLLEPVLSHRIILRPESEMDGTSVEDVLIELFEQLDLWEVS